jgi:hypothetical protein
MNSSAPISGFVRPTRASRAMCTPCGVRSSRGVPALARTLADALAARYLRGSGVAVRPVHRSQ